MTQHETLKYIAEGHSLWTVETAVEIAGAFGLELPDSLIIRWRNQKDANPTNEPKGIWLDEPGKPGEGVGSIELSNWLTLELGANPRSYHGRGSQARANAAAIEKLLDSKRAAKSDSQSN